MAFSKLQINCGGKGGFCCLRWMRWSEYDCYFKELLIEVVTDVIGWSFNVLFIIFSFATREGSRKLACNQTKSCYATQHKRSLLPPPPKTAVDRFQNLAKFRRNTNRVYRQRARLEAEEYKRRWVLWYWYLIREISLSCSEAKNACEFWSKKNWKEHLVGVLT